MAIGKLKSEAELERWLWEQLESLSLNSVQGLGDQLAMLMPPGTVVAWAGAGVPTNYLECNGAAVSRTKYAGLFKAIGTTYGVGDGSTTFNLPSLAGESLLSGEAETPLKWVIKL